MLIKLFVQSLFLIFISTQAAFAGNTDKTTLTGKVTDKASGKPILGVTIVIPDLKTGTATDENGNYQIGNLPRAKVLVQLSFLGYKTIIATIDLAKDTIRNFAMEESITEMNEVVVTGTSKATEIKRDPVPIMVIKRAQVDENLSTNIIDAIAKEPGVNAVTTGPNVSKPFIRGLGYNRVLTLYDGVRQEGQQWGDEHGIEVDQYSIDKIEIVKGPASLTYGSDALAGVVNLLPAPPVPEGTIKGEVVSDYQTNNGLFGLSGAAAGNSNGLIWGSRVSHKQATNYQDPVDGRVYGTAFNETDANAYIGLNKEWGYSHLSFSLFDDLQEIPDGSRDSLTRKFTKQITEADTFGPVVSDQELNSYTIAALHQHVQHYKLISSNSFALGAGKLGVILGYQQNIRREFSHPEDAAIAGLYLVLKSYTYDFKYYLPETNGWETTVGINGMYQTNTNDGTEFIIPNYHQFDIGPFAYTKKEFNKLDISGGIRYDSRSFTNDGMYTLPNPQTGFDMLTSIPDTAGAAHPFSNYQHTFSGVSGSIGATYNFSNNFLLKANIARGFRAPNIAEISANGVHPGTNIYQIGNLDFKPEFSLQEDVGIIFSSTHVSGSVELFNNNISNYIYNQKILNKAGQDSIIVPGNQTFQFEESNAQLYGGEASIDIHPHPLDWLHFENSVSVIYAINKGVNGVSPPDSAKYLPFIPPLHTNSELRAHIKTKATHFTSLYIKVGMEYYAAQDRVFLAYNTETATPSYTLFNAGAGTDVTNKAGKVLFSIHISGTNITDVAYQSHLSRLKYFEQYSASPNGHLGIYNMGRNIGFKIVVPLDFKKQNTSDQNKS